MSLAWEDRPHILLVHVADELLARRFDQAVAAPEKETETEHIAAKRAPFWMLSCSQDETVMMIQVRPPHRSVSKPALVNWRAHFLGQATGLPILWPSLNAGIASAKSTRTRSDILFWSKPW